MQITKATPSFAGKGIIIPKNLNKSKTYLYNEVIDIVKVNKVPALVGNDGIKIEVLPDSKALDKVTDTLNQAGIKFNKLA